MDQKLMKPASASRLGEEPNRALNEILLGARPPIPVKWPNGHDFPPIESQ
jgi:hypothetical protein